MMPRLLVAVLLLHHIEGVCKPFSAATAAIKAIIDGFVQRSVTRHPAAAVERARQSQAAAIERARLSRGAAATVSRRSLPAIEAVPLVMPWMEPAQTPEEHCR